MRELELFEQYLVRLRQERLQLGHQKALAATAENVAEVRSLAHEAELVQRIIGALRELNADPGEFIKGYLK